MTSGQEPHRNDERGREEGAREGAPRDEERETLQDADLLLIGDYIAGELDEVKTRGVEERLERDTAFAERAAPLLAIREILQEELVASELKRAFEDGEAEKAPVPSPVPPHRHWIAGFVTTVAGVVVGALITAKVILAAQSPSVGLRNVVAGTIEGQVFWGDNVTLDRGISFTPRGDLTYALNDHGREWSLPRAPGQYEMHLDGDADVRIDLPPTRELSLFTPFAIVRTQHAKFQVSYVRPCATMIAVTDGDVFIKSRFGGDSTRITPGNSMSVDCKKVMSQGAPVGVPGQMTPTVETLPAGTEIKP